jgi:hypothetical protein
MAQCLSPAAQARYREQGWVMAPARLTDDLLAPVTAVARDLAAQNPWQERLSGIHNPFGGHAAAADAWKFLDIAESAVLLDPLEDVLGPDLVLWDSELYLDFAAFTIAEAQYWPVDPLAGALVVVSLQSGALLLVDITRLADSGAPLPLDAGPHYVLRYMPATSHFNRDPRFPPTRLASEARPLVNYISRPIWLLRGEDRAGNDFTTGFVAPAPRWAGGRNLPRTGG